MAIESVDGFQRPWKLCHSSGTYSMQLYNMFFYPKLYLLGLLVILFIFHVTGDPASDSQNSERAALKAQLAKSTTCSSSKLLVRYEW
jgi:hypothetical protein